MMEGLRFFAVAVTGLVLDLVVAWGAARYLGIPLWLAAALGFAVAAGINYVLHELWTFNSGARQLSGGRALRYGMALAATLGVRVFTVAVLSVIIGKAWPLPVLILGAGVSFIVNYLISKYFVFRPEPEESAP